LRSSGVLESGSLSATQFGGEQVLAASSLACSRVLTPEAI
jgi:hypothetical protein